MTAANFDRALALLLVSEGGYANNPRDPGGATKYGITIATLRNYRGRSVTVDDVRQLTSDEAGAIYHQNYWAPIRGDLLPSGVDYAVFDYAVNSGPSSAAKVLQECLSVAADGDVGPVTWRAAAQVRATDLINALCDRRLAYLRSLGTWADFGAGWSARVARVRADAVKMAGDKTATAPPPILPPRQPDDPGIEPSRKPASGGLSHVGSAGVVAGAGAIAATAGVSMGYVIAFMLGAVVGLAIPYASKVKAALTGDPTTKPAAKPAITVPAASLPQQGMTATGQAQPQAKQSADKANAPQAAVANSAPPADRGA